MTSVLDSATALPHLGFDWPQGPDFADIISREWLVTNGRGGYASGTVATCNTRRYHGLFVPSLPKHGRMVLLARLVEQAHVDGHLFQLSTEEHTDGEGLQDGIGRLRSFYLDGLIPVWEYDLGPSRLRRKLMMVHGENTLFVAWEHVSGPEIHLRLRPFPVARHHDRPIPGAAYDPIVRIQEGRLEMQATPDAPVMRMRLLAKCAMPFVALSQSSQPLLYRTERARGYDYTERQYSPGYFECSLGPGELLSLGVTTDDWWVLDREPEKSFELERERERKLLMRASEEARGGVPARLVLAADQFIIDPMRPKDDAWARSIGQDARSVIAGYHWFTDWGRDTMISLEGLTLSTGRYRE
ncbi:glycogen debranching enzyme N-terminal domain-containing protein, partial [Hyalangium sp.]|uniref:glycogen debranching enzyme N-terminal domain-containing protein n=1 Tax=Hyalangium sp. TaxID=2028555 RepID=UPI002D6B5574